MPRATLGRICLLLAASVLIPGCGASHQSGVGRFAGPSDAPSPSRSSEILRGAEIQSAPVNNAQEALVRLRPEFLRRREASAVNDPGAGLPTVYVDGVRQGGPDMLLSIPAGAILEIRYLNAVAAASAFGPYHPGAVISVRTKR